LARPTGLSPPSPTTCCPACCSARRRVEVCINRHILWLVRILIPCRSVSIFPQEQPEIFAAALFLHHTRVDSGFVDSVVVLATTASSSACWTAAESALTIGRGISIITDKTIEEEDDDEDEEEEEETVIVSGCGYHPRAMSVSSIRYLVPTRSDLSRLGVVRQSYCLVDTKRTAFSQCSLITIDKWIAFFRL
jgi:hypothetical protein